MKNLVKDKDINKITPSTINGPLPEELKYFSWGAFIFTWLWGLPNKVRVSLVTLGLMILAPLFYYQSLETQQVAYFWIALLLTLCIPVTAFILGLKGNEWAWKYRKFKNIAEFKSVDRRWINGGMIWLIFWLIIAFIAFGYLYLSILVLVGS